jgi:cytochrome c oxidase subunit 2
MPQQASSWAWSVDWINNFITYVAAFCTVAITGAMLHFAYKYRRKGPNDKTEYITHDSTLETVWTVVPTIVCIFVGFCGFFVYKDMRTPPANPIEIQVTGQKWYWTYKYPNGKTADNDMVVPVNQPVRLIMKSRDVNHSFFIPAMRVKEDVIGSDYHYLWFLPTETGNFHIFCAEYCGKSHSKMTGTLRVVSASEYEDFINDRKKEELPPDELGKKLYASKACITCHSLDGSKVLGPSFKGLFGREEELTDGQKIKVDESYLRESILYSNKKIVKGFQPVMPSYEGQLKDEEIDGLIAYIKTIQ